MNDPSRPGHPSLPDSVRWRAAAGMPVAWEKLCDDCEDESTTIRVEQQRKEKFRRRKEQRQPKRPAKTA